MSKFLVLFCAAACAASPVYQDATASVEARVADLLARMTLEERAAQTWAVHNAHDWVLGERAATGYGEQKLSGWPTNDPAELLGYRNAYQSAVLDGSRLRIPLSFYQETLAMGGPGGVCFPLPVGLGASFDPALVRDVARVKALEARATGADLGFSPRRLPPWTRGRGPA